MPTVYHDTSENMIYFLQVFVPLFYWRFEFFKSPSWPRNPESATQLAIKLLRIWHWGSKTESDGDRGKNTVSYFFLLFRLNHISPEKSPSIIAQSRPILFFMIFYGENCFELSLCLFFFFFVASVLPRREQQSRANPDNKTDALF